MSDVGFIQTSALAAFFCITEEELRSWLSTKIAPENLRIPGRSDGPRLADPDVRDIDLCTANDVCAYYRISRETLRRWVRDGKFPPPDGPVHGGTYSWKVRTARNPGIKLKMKRRLA